MAVSIINTDIIRKHPTQAVLTVLGLSGVGYALALMVVVLFSLLVLLLWWESDLRVRDLPFFASLALGLGAGVWSVIQHLRRGTPLPLTALVAMQLAYLPFALGWLAAGPIIALIWGE